MVPRRGLLTTALLSPFVARAAAAADMPGVTDREIKIGNTVPYSGPASAYGTSGKTIAAVFRMINDGGGVNGRMVKFISLDDGFSPPKTVEQTRRLVEGEGVSFFVAGLGTATQTAVRPYLNGRGIPQLFVQTGAEKFADPEHFPWTIGFAPSYQTEAQIFGKFILKEKADARVGLLYQNDDMGKDYLFGLRQILGGREKGLMVAEVSYEISDATIDSQLVTLQSAGADVLVSAATPKFAAQAIRKLSDLNWRPLHLMGYPSNSVGAVLVPAGVEKAVGLISTTFFKDNTDPSWADDPAIRGWRAFMATYVPDADLTDRFNLSSYINSLALIEVLKQCGNDLSRENIMHQATNLHDVVVPCMLPGALINTSKTNYHPLRSLQMQRFNGKTWELFGALIST